MSYRQTEGELREHLKDNIAFLISSAKAYDQGNHNEAKRIAVALRVLLYDTKISKSILSQLGVNFKFFDFSLHYDGDSETGMPTMRVLHIEIDDKTNEAKYIPVFENIPPNLKRNERVDFKSWWNQKIIVDQEGNNFKRKDLILMLSNKDGGAHVDPKLGDAYASLSRKNSLGWKSIDEKGERKELSIKPQLASIRHICHEVLKSLYCEYPELFSEWYEPPAPSGMQICGVELKKAGQNNL